MATYLYKLGRLAFRRRHYFALIWVLLLAGAIFGAAKAPAAGASSFSIPGTEAQRAFDLLEERVPGASPDGATARVVFQAPEGEKVTDPKNKKIVEETLAELKSPDVATIADPFLAKTISQKDNGRTAYAAITYKVNGMELEESTREGLKEVSEADKGMTVEVGGDALQPVPETGSTEIIGIAVAAVVLVITFGALLSAGLPLITALIGVGAGVSTITALSSTFGFDSSTATLATMIGLAVGIDYALFIVSRYRTELAEGREREEAAGRAVGTAGSAVVFAGLTVLIALVGLSVVDIPVLSKMGYTAAGTVAIAVLIALTLIPALLGYAGKKVRPAGVRGRVFGGGKAKDVEGPVEVREGAKPNMGTRWAKFVMRRPVMVLLASVIGLGVVALPVAGLQLGLPDDGYQPEKTTQRQAYDMISEGFGPGFNGPLLMVYDLKGVDGDVKDRDAAVNSFNKEIKKAEPKAVIPPLDPKMSFDKKHETAIVTVVPNSKPSSVETEEFVLEIRELAAEAEKATGADIMVSGATAMNIDFSEKLDKALAPYLALVVGLAFLLLMVVFRSILVPLKAALGFLLSVLAALGSVVAVFQWGWLGSIMGVEETGPIMSMMPIFLVGVVFGLAMDYEVFLVTRMREAFVHGEDPKQAVVTGFRYSARVVTAAAIIMIAVFAGFIGSSEQMIKMIGFGLAIAVFFDAFVVRMAIVPAVLALLGRSAWWLPGWLARILPNVDVEGEGLSALDKDKAVPADSDEDRELARV